MGGHSLNNWSDLGGGAEGTEGVAGRRVGLGGGGGLP